MNFQNFMIKINVIYNFIKKPKIVKILKKRKKILFSQLVMQRKEKI